jgi:hypothetical protein
MRAIGIRPEIERERIMSEKCSQRGNVQNTGNPVLDSTVNIVMAIVAGQSEGDVVIPKLEEIHETILKLAVKEPGGLKNWSGATALQ